MNPRTRTVVILGSAAAVVLVGTLIVVGQNQAESGADASGPRASTAPSTAAPSATPSATPQATQLPSSVPPVVSDPLPADPAATAAPGERYSTEVLPPSAPEPTGLPPSKPLPELVSLPLPAADSASGRLVSGFPSAVIPTAPLSQVVDSSVTAEGHRLQATLNATTRSTGAEVLDYYRGAFAPVGLYDSAAPAAAGSSALVFARDGSSITLTVTDDVDGCSYSIFATLSAAS